MKSATQRLVHRSVQHGWRRAAAGNAVECACCGSTFRSFMPAGRPKRPNTECPVCGSRERHRLLALYLSQSDRKRYGRVLHLAPEPALSRLLEPASTSYVTVDIAPGHADVVADLTRLPFEDRAWDLVICNHVLEHVTDDTQAMRETLRVLEPTGQLLLVVPRIPGTQTDEDPSIVSPAERLRRFGQADHVRRYGDDLEERLSASGFDVTSIGLDGFPPEVVERHRLAVRRGASIDAILLCTPSASGHR